MSRLLFNTGFVRHQHFAGALSYFQSCLSTAVHNPPRVDRCEPELSRYRVVLPQQRGRALRLL